MCDDWKEEMCENPEKCCVKCLTSSLVIHLVGGFIAWHCGDRVGGDCLGPGQYLAPCLPLNNGLPVSPTALGPMYDTSDCETYQAAGDSCAVVCAYGYKPCNPQLGDEQQRMYECPADNSVHVGLIHHLMPYALLDDGTYEPTVAPTLRVGPRGPDEYLCARSADDCPPPPQNATIHPLPPPPTPPQTFEPEANPPTLPPTPPPPPPVPDGKATSCAPLTGLGPQYDVSDCGAPKQPGDSCTVVCAYGYTPCRLQRGDSVERMYDCPTNHRKGTGLELHLRGNEDDFTCCPIDCDLAEGWYQSPWMSCFQVARSHGSNSECQQYCREQGGTLATPRTKEEDYFMTGMCKATGSNCWLDIRCDGTGALDGYRNYQRDACTNHDHNTCAGLNQGVQPIVPISCSASSEFNNAYGCKNVYDNDLLGVGDPPNPTVGTAGHASPHASASSWASNGHQEGKNGADFHAAITLNFGRPNTFSAMAFAQRANIAGQCFGDVRLTFDDNVTFSHVVLSLGERHAAHSRCALSACDLSLMLPEPCCRVAEQNALPIWLPTTSRL